MCSRRNCSLTLFATLAIAVGCSGPHGPDDGVDDVLIACQVRAQWTRSSHVECQACTVNAASTPCACNPNIGACHAQAQAEANESDCTSDVKACVQTCGTDCACVDHCYTAHAACREVASAKAGCVADACDAECR